MKKLVLSLMLLASLLAFTCPSGAEISTLGIPADTHMYYGGDFTHPQLAGIINDIFTRLRNTEEFDVVLKKVSEKLQVNVSRSLLDVYQTVNQIAIGLTINAKNPEVEPTLMLVVTFKDAAAANTAVGMLQEKIEKELADDVTVGTLKAGNHTLVSLDKTPKAAKKVAQKFFKKISLNYYVADDKVSFYVLPKSDENGNRATIIENIAKSIDCLNDDKKTIKVNKELADLIKRTDANSPFLLFVPGSTVDLINSKNPNQMPVPLRYLGLATLPGADISNIKSVFLAVMKDLEKDPMVKQFLPMVKSLLAGGTSAMGSLPADTIFAIGLSLNITKEHLAFPPIKQQLMEMKKNQLNLEELFLNWFGGELAVAVSKYDIPAEEDIKKQVFNMPDIYISFKTKDGKAALKGIETLLQMSPFPLMPADVTIAGQKVKAIPLPMVPPNIKKVGVHFGIIGDYLVITTTKEAMEKAAAIAGDAGKALTSTPLYKDCIDGTGFLSFFVNAAELTRLQKIAKMMAPGAADIDELPAFQKGLGIAASFSGDTIKLMMGQKLDMQMAMDFAIKTLKKKFPAPKK